MIAFEREN